MAQRTIGSSRPAQTWSGLRRTRRCVRNPPLCRKPRILVTYLPKVLQELLQRHKQASMGLPANISEDADLYGRPAEPFVVPTIWGMWDGGVDIHFALPRMVAPAVMHGMAASYAQCTTHGGSFAFSDLEHWLVSTLVALLRKQSRQAPAIESAKFAFRVARVNSTDGRSLQYGN